MKRVLAGLVGFVGLNAFMLTFFISNRLPEHESILADVLLVNLFIGGIGLMALGLSLAVAP